MHCCWVCTEMLDEDFHHSQLVPGDLSGLGAGAVGVFSCSA